MAARPRWLLDAPHDFDDALRLEPLLAAPIWLPSNPLLEPWPVAPPGPLVAFGAMRTLRRLARHAPLARAVLDDWSRLACTDYYPHVYDLLRRDAVFAPLCALERLDLARRFGPRVFIRPNGNHKPFEAKLIGPDEVSGLLSAHQAHLGELVVLAEPVRFVAEWRCWCRAGQLVTASSYPGPPYQAPPGEAVQLALTAAARLDAGLGQGFYTVDVGALEDGRMALVECGGVGSWGLYGCDLEAFVRACEDEARERGG
jgi:hypothetical protein